MTSVSLVNSSPPSRDVARREVTLGASFVRRLPSGITKSSFSVRVHSTLLKIIRSALSLDVSRYSESSELFVCRDKCYQRLIKFNRASNKLKELKKEIEEVFKAKRNLRAKRLLHPDEIADRGSKNTSTSSPR